MNRLTRSCLSLGAALPLLAEMPDPPSGIVVQVYNYGEVAQGILRQAEQEAARIFLDAGIEAEWLDCPLSPAEAPLYPGCQAPAGSTVLSLRIVSRDMAAPMNLPKMSFGRAWLPEDGGPGFVAAVCAHKAAELAKRSRGPEGVILGHLMAHELGHLLLGSQSHAASGLMGVPWLRPELELIRQGSMFFSSQEGKRMRALLQERAELAATSPGPVAP